MGVLVERNVVRGVIVAEDVAAMSTVMPTFEEGEGFLTGR